MFERTRVVLVMLVVSGCPTAPDEPAPRAEVDEPEPAVAPVVEPVVPEFVPVIQPVDGLISQRGLPQHVSFSLANASAKPVRVVLTGVDHGSDKRTALIVGEIQWWGEAATEPKILAVDEALELAAGEVGQLTVYLGTWSQTAIDAGEVDAMSESYRLIGKFTVDEVANDVTVVVRRATRTPG